MLLDINKRSFPHLTSSCFMIKLRIKKIIKVFLCPTKANLVFLKIRTSREVDRKMILEII